MLLSISNLVFTKMLLTKMLRSMQALTIINIFGAITNVKVSCLPILFWWYLVMMRLSAQLPTQ